MNQQGFIVEIVCKKLILVIDQLEFPVPFPCFVAEDPD